MRLHLMISELEMTIKCNLKSNNSSDSNYFIFPNAITWLIGIFSRLNYKYITANIGSIVFSRYLLTFIPIYINPMY